MTQELELGARKDAGHWVLSSPDAGVFTCSLPKGSALAPGQHAGVLLRLGRASVVTVPPGVHGVVSSERPERVHRPVGAGEDLYELTPLDDFEGQAAGGEAQEEDAGAYPTLRSPQAGRFYASSSPSDPPFVKEGSEVRDGTAVGLIEVMKTFTQVVYRADGRLPSRARVRRILVPDGGDVAAGDPLIEVEGEDDARS